MSSMIGRGFLWLILLFFVYETIDEFNGLFHLALEPVHSVIPVILFFGLHEYAIRVRRDTGITGREAKFSRPFYISAWFLIGGLLAFVVIVWAGVIYKQIVQAR